MWRYTGNGEGYPGLPFDDMADEEMTAAIAEYEPRFRETHGTVAASGLWTHEAGSAPLGGSSPVPPAEAEPAPNAQDPDATSSP